MTLEEEERQALIAIIDASLRVLTRPHFFSWTQGVAQALIPHEILICGVSGGPGQGMRMYRFSSSRYFSDAHFGAVCRPEIGLIHQMIDHWDVSGEPLLIGRHEKSGVFANDLTSLEEHEMRNSAAHGMRSADGSIKSFFCFSRVREPFSPRLGYILNILIPFLDATLNRVLALEERERRKVARVGTTLTARELQILHWLKEGRSNVQIAAILGISQHTVKNHMRRIFLKLGVQSRARAIIKAMQLGVLQVSRD